MQHGVIWTLFLSVGNAVPCVNSPYNLNQINPIIDLRHQLIVCRWQHNNLIELDNLKRSIWTVVSGLLLVCLLLIGSLWTVFYSDVFILVCVFSPHVLLVIHSGVPVLSSCVVSNSFYCACSLFVCCW